MPRLKLTIEYDGTGYVGWQRQLNGPAVQDAFERALATLLGASTETFASGRTDSGVHAAGQVVAFWAPKSLPLRAYVRGLNGLLPPDISVTTAEEVPDGFDPRRWASGKRYRYLISNRPDRSALRRNSHWEIFAPLDLRAMQGAALCLLGRHDFSAFRASDCQARHAVRELKQVELSQGGAEELVLDVGGTAFLKHMVRNLVGSLVEVGKGKKPVEWMEQLLVGKDRSRAGPTAPPQGLTLIEVTYGGRQKSPQLIEDDDD